MTPNFKSIVAKVGCPCHVWGAIKFTTSDGTEAQRCVNVRDLANYGQYASYTLLVSSLQHPHITTKVELTHAELFAPK